MLEVVTLLLGGISLHGDGRSAANFDSCSM